MNEYTLKDNLPYVQPDRQKSTVKTGTLPPLPEVPIPTEKKFLKKKNWLLDKKIIKEDDIKQPFLILMGEDKNDIILENVNEGLLEVKDKKNKIIGEILIDSNKIRTLNYGGFKLNYYVGYKKEATLYPHEVVHDSKDLRLIIQKMMVNADIMKKKTGFDMLIIFIIGGAIIAIIIYMLWSSGKLDSLLN